VNLRKELKKMGLIAGKKKSEQMFKVGIVMWALFVLIILYSVIGG
jgi:hypothetical protein